jgi:GNAT superfamily N-acetyltransferase
LHSAAVAELRDRGFREATLWVIEANPRARRFYEREGWHPDGVERREEIGEVEVTEVRYRRGIAA